MKTEPARRAAASATVSQMDQHSAAYVAYSVALVLGMVLSFTFAAPVEIMLMPLLGNAATYVATVGLLVTPMLLALLKRRFL